MKKSQLWAGILSPPIALGGIGVAIIINRSWWRLTDNAISDLGKVGLPYNWVMNVPLFISAVLAIYYAVGLFNELKNTLSKIGIGVFITGLFFLVGIAIFPEGTKPHYAVSWGFFICASVGYLVVGLGLWRNGHGGIGVFSTVLFAMEVILTTWAFRTFEGVAVPESIAIFAVVVWHYVLLLSLVRGHS